MAKQSSSRDVNKTALIMEAIGQHPDASPTKIAEIAGHGITAKYVSTVKSNAKAGEKKKAKKKPGRPKGVRSAGPASAAANGSLGAAISFIESAGGLKAAKQQIETIERIKQL